MDFYEAQDFFKAQYPGKTINYEFDDACHRFNEIVLTDGSPNMYHHVECRKVKVTVEGQDPFYVPIAPHRMTVTWVDMKKIANVQLSKSDVCIPDGTLDDLNNASSDILDAALNNIISMTGLTKNQILQKMKNRKAQSLIT